MGLLSYAAASASFPVEKDTLLKVNRNGRVISLDLLVPDKVSTVEVRIFSNANNSIIEYSDVSPYAPQSKRAQTGEVFDPDWQKKEDIDRQANRELRFPVVDVAMAPGMEALIEFDMKEPVLLQW